MFIQNLEHQRQANKVQNILIITYVSIYNTDQTVSIS